jgi:hypothetical protein
MDMGTWIDLLGKSQDDSAVKAALAAAGVKKVPKLPKDDLSVIFDLKGHGLALEMSDEAWLKRLKDQDIGEGPLILTSVDAYFVRKKSKDVYKGALPYKLAADVTKAELRKKFGRPARTGDDIPYDIWVRDGLEVTAGYTDDLGLEHFEVKVPRSKK